MEGKRKMEPLRGPWLGVSQPPQALLGFPGIWLENHWNYYLLRPWNLRVSHPRSSHSTLSTSYVTWDKWPHLSGLCFEAVVRFSQAGKVLSDWETYQGFLCFLVKGQSVQDCTSRGEGRWVAMITGRAGHLFRPYAEALVQGQQSQRHRQLTHSEDIARPCVRTKTRVLTGELAWPRSCIPG